MKKLNWLIALLSVFSLTMVACGGDEVDGKKPAPQKPIEQSFDITLDDVTYFSADLTVTPADENADYVVMLYTAEQYESYKERYFIKTVFQELKDEARTIGMTLSEYLVEQGYVTRGVAELECTDLTPNTDFYLVAFGVDVTGEAKATTDVFKLKFSTEEAPVSDVTFDINTTVNDTTATVVVTPSDVSAIWWYNAFPKAQYDEYLTMVSSPEELVDILYKEQLQKWLNGGSSIQEAINNTLHICSDEMPSKTFTLSNLVYNTEYINVIAGFVVDLETATVTLATDVTTTTFYTGDIGEVNLTFDITVENIEAVRASVKVVPSDLTQTFNWQVGIYDGESTPEQVMNSIMPYGLYTGIQNYPNFSLEAPDTEYYIIAYGYARGVGITTAPTMKTFRTLPAPAAEETTFEVTVNAASISPYGFTFNVEASHGTTYYFMDITTADNYKPETIAAEYNAAVDEAFEAQKLVYGTNYSMPEFLAQNYFRGNFDNATVKGLTPGTTYMAYVCALDINTGHIAKFHTFENLVTTKSLGDVRPTIVSIKHYSGRDENGTIWGNADATKTLAIVVVEFGGLEDARSLFSYMPEGDASDIMLLPDADVWDLAAGYWGSVSIQQPYAFYTCRWDVVHTALAYTVDKSGKPGLITRQLHTPILDTKSDIEELRALVNELNAASGKSVSALSASKSLVVAE